MFGKRGGGLNLGDVAALKQEQELPKQAPGDAKQDARERLRSSTEALATIVDDRKVKLLEGEWLPISELVDPEIWERVEMTAGNTFGNIKRAAVGLLEEFAEAEALGLRKALKAQEGWFKVKMETTRLAGKVTLKNKQRELEAHAAKKLQEKVKELSQGGDVLLQEATARIEALSEELSEVSRKFNATDEALRALKEKAVMLERRNKKLEADDADARGPLRQALEALGLSADGPADGAARDPSLLLESGVSKRFGRRASLPANFAQRPSKEEGAAPAAAPGGGAQRSVPELMEEMLSALLQYKSNAEGGDPEVARLETALEEARSTHESELGELRAARDELEKAVSSAVTMPE